MVLGGFRRKYFPDKTWVFKGKFNAEVIGPLDNGFLLIKPQTFMNNSGDAVLEISRYYKVGPSDILVVHDDLDLAVSEFRLQRGRNAAGHHGVESIIEKLGTRDFWRLRVGIDNKSQLRSSDPSKFVLEEFSKEELLQIQSLLGGKLHSVILGFK